MSPLVKTFLTARTSNNPNLKKLMLKGVEEALKAMEPDSVLDLSEKIGDSESRTEFLKLAGIVAYAS